MPALILNLHVALQGSAAKAHSVPQFYWSKSLLQGQAALC